MMSLRGMDRIDRNLYVRYTLKILVDKYLINQAQVAHSLKVSPKYLREFANGTRNLSHSKLDEIEEFLLDLYKPILDEELPDTEGSLLALIELIRPRD